MIRHLHVFLSKSPGVQTALGVPSLVILAFSAQMLRQT